MLREILQSIKEIIVDYVKSRLFPVTVVVLVLFSILVHQLFVLQIKEGEEHMENFVYKSKKTLTIDSVRGNIYDCNGNLLAYNELSYSVVFSNDNAQTTMAKNLKISENELKNQIVDETISILEKNGDSLTLDFPIKLDANGNFQFTVKDQQLKNFLKDVYAKTDYDSMPDEQKNATADDIMEYLNTKVFDVSDSYSKEADLKIVGVRYKLWMNRYQQYVPVTIAYDISETSNAAITEHADELPGMSVSVKSLRRYNDAKYFAHVIGYIGAISDEEMKEKNAKLSDEEQYTNEEMIGKTGIEQYCESYLRGTNGLETMYVDNLGKVIDTVESKPATAGNDVYLTLDLNLQKYCYDTLEDEITSIILSYLTPAYNVIAKENASIAISDVYFGLFNNNILSQDDMRAEDATDTEKATIQAIDAQRQATLDLNLQKYCYDTLEDEITSIILSYLTPAYNVIAKENASIAISDVYFGLFNNNILSQDDMRAEDATDTEKATIQAIDAQRQATLDNLYTILTSTFTPLSELDENYQHYMEYICEVLSDNNIFHTSMIDKDDQEFIDYTNNVTSLEHYLKYAISQEAIDLSALKVESDYYDNDEIYNALCDYIIEYLSTDSEFDKLVIKVMLQSGMITGDAVVQLLYDQGILNVDGDTEYQEYLAGNYGAYDFMRKKIQNQEITPAMLALDICSGSAIVTDVNTGDVKAYVSYPSYDNNYLTNEVDTAYYNQLLADKTTPLYNRASQQRTAPGSTYKPLVAIAGLTEGVIDTGSIYFCNGLFEKITPSPKCWGNSAHGGLNVVGGIQHSCNLFFYNLGYDLAIKDGSYNDAYGVERIQKYAELFGLGDKSGLELPEIEPHISDNDSVRSAIGQAKNIYAPVQLSRYVTTIANSGTCYNLTLIDKVTDYEGNVILDNHAEVKNQVQLASSTWDAVHQGMRNVVAYSAGSDELINRINVHVAGKTGTAQESEDKPDHALFVSYAPYESPEVSVTCVIQNGYSSANARELAGFIYAYMYDPDKLVGAEMSGNATPSQD